MGDTDDAAADAGTDASDATVLDAAPESAVTVDSGSTPDATPDQAAAEAAVDGGDTCTNPIALGSGLDAWILFDAAGPDFVRHLYAIRPDGCGQRRVTSDTSDESDAAFSPDGTRIAFTSSRVGGTNQLFILRLVGGGIRQITSLAAGAAHPAWMLRTARSSPSTAVRPSTTSTRSPSARHPGESCPRALERRATTSIRAF